jgi:hypothetical protein
MRPTNDPSYPDLWPDSPTRLSSQEFRRRLGDPQAPEYWTRGEGLTRAIQGGLLLLALAGAAQCREVQLAFRDAARDLISEVENF